MKKLIYLSLLLFTSLSINGQVVKIIDPYVSFMMELDTIHDRDTLDYYTKFIYNTVFDDIGEVQDDAQLIQYDFDLLAYSSFSPELQVEYQHLIDTVKTLNIQNLQMLTFNKISPKLFKEVLFRIYENGGENITFVVPFENAEFPSASGTILGLNTRRYDYIDYNELKNQIDNGTITRENAKKGHLYFGYDNIGYSVIDSGKDYQNYISNNTKPDLARSNTVLHENGHGILNFSHSNSITGWPQDLMGSASFWPNYYITYGECYNEEYRKSIISKLLDQNRIEIHCTYDFELKANQDIVCVGDTIEIELIDTVGNEFFWQGDFISKDGNQVMFSADSLGIYTLIGGTRDTTANCLWRFDTLQIEVLKNIEIDTIISITNNETITLVDGTVLTDMDNGKTGSYFLSDGASNGCDLTVNWEVKVVTSTYNFTNFGLIKLYPNPVKNELTIESSQRPIMNITISDIAGKLIQKHTSNSKKSILNTSELKNGKYIISIELQDGERVLSKIVKF